MLDFLEVFFMSVKVHLRSIKSPMFPSISFSCCDTYMKLRVFYQMNTQTGRQNHADNFISISIQTPHD